MHETSAAVLLLQLHTKLHLYAHQSFSLILFSTSIEAIAIDIRRYLRLALHSDRRLGQRIYGIAWSHQKLNGVLSEVDENPVHASRNE